MVKKALSLVAALAMCVSATIAQENQVNRLPEVNPAYEVNDYTTLNRGFWMAAEAAGGYSLRLNHSNFGFGEVDFTAGYRLSEYFRLGAGFGFRHYIDNDKVRYSDIAWSFPLYVNFRGNFIPTGERNVVPYYSVDFGGAIRDGIMLRPTIGLRIGQPRKAFIVGLSYTGQELKIFDYDENHDRCSKKKFASFISLRLGYEF